MILRVVCTFAFAFLLLSVAIADPMDGALVDAEPKKCIGCRAMNAVKGTLSEVVDTVGNIADPDSAVQARKEIDEAEGIALKKLLKDNQAAKDLYSRAYGYGVFDTRKFSFILTTGGGAGVVHELSSGKRTYMKMATAGANIGYGAQFYQLVFMFENEKTLKEFTSGRWDAGVAADVVAGKDSIEGAVSFVDGLAVFHMNDTGIKLTADLTGTRYWVSDELNGKS